MKKRSQIATLSIYILAILLGSSSCSREEFLNITPKGVVIPTTGKDFRLLMDNNQLFIYKHSNNRFMTDNAFIHPDLVTELGFTQTDINLYLFKENIYVASQDDSDWNTYYQQILNTNIVLERIDGATEATAKEIATIKAEAKLQEAYAYFNLVNLYAVHYNNTTAATDLGVPIRTGSELIGVDLTRASVGAVYDKIINNIESSINDLPDTQPSNYNFRPSKAAAYGLLAKVRLYRAEYDKALIAAENALAIHNTLRDINNEFVDDSDPNVNIRQWPDVHKDPQVVWHKSVIVDFALSKEYNDLFSQNDLRKQWIVSYNDLAPGSFNNIDAYSLQANQGDFQSGTAGIYTPDLYLIRAECNARLNNLIEALVDYNELRSKRYATGTYTELELTNTNQADLLNSIKDERRREFPNSTERAFDIKRYNLYDGDNIIINHSYANESVSVPANSKNWATPIGQKYINFNPEIEQNPRD